MPSEDRIADAELVEEARAGCRDSFGLLVRKHAPSVRRLTRAICGDDARGDDVAQEAFLRAFEKLDALADPSSFRAWLLRIGRNRAIEVCRRQAGISAGHESIDSLAELGVVAGWGALSPERIVQHRQMLRLVSDAMRRLSGQDQEILLLRDVEGLSSTEVASILGIHLNATKSRLHRARLRLMALLREVESYE